MYNKPWMYENINYYFFHQRLKSITLFFLTLEQWNPNNIIVSMSLAHVIKWNYKYEVSVEFMLVFHLRYGMLFPTKKQWKLLVQRHIRKKQLKGGCNAPCMNGNVREEALLLMIYRLFASSFTLTINFSPIKLSNKNGGWFNRLLQLPHGTKILRQYLFACTLLCFSLGQYLHVLRGKILKDTA